MATPSRGRGGALRILAGVACLVAILPAMSALPHTSSTRAHMGRSSAFGREVAGPATSALRPALDRPGNGAMQGENSTPVEVPGLRDVAAIASGGPYDLALKKDGTVWVVYTEVQDYPANGASCFPLADAGAGCFTVTSVRVRGLTGVTAIAAGLNEGLALRSDGTVWSWSYGDHTARPTAPVQVNGLADVVAIAVGGAHDVALKRDGTVWIWSPAWPDVLDSGLGFSTTPAQMPRLGHVLAISAAFVHSLALKKDGIVWSWSDTLGYATDIGTTVPRPVAGLTGVAAISAAFVHSLALKTDGTVWSWDQVSPGGPTVDTRLVRVSGLTGMVAISAGDLPSLALKNDGTVWAWSALPVGLRGIPIAPAPVRGLGSIVAIASGGIDNLALKKDGTVWIWSFSDVPISVPTPTASPAPVQVRGAGVSLAGSLVPGGWVPGYTALHPNVTISYTVTSPADGVARWTAGRADFAVDDTLLTPAQQSAAAARCGSGVSTIPVAVGAVALTYNLPGVRTGLRLPPDILTRIFLGDIREWSDVLIQRANPDVRLPQVLIHPVYRSDDSGSTDVLTRYLAVLSPTWRARVGVGPRISWPAGQGATGSLGIVARVLRTPGAIGYVDLADALAHHLPVAMLHDHAGAEIVPSVASAEVAADSFAPSMPADLQQRIADAPATGAYPLAGYVYVNLCEAQGGARGRTLVDFVRYVVTTGQAAVRAHVYAPMPSSVRDAALAALDAMARGPATSPTPPT